MVQRLLVPFLRPLMKSTTKGAATSIHLASAPGLEQVTGCYFANGKRKRSSPRSYDEPPAASLWQASSLLVGLSPTTQPDPDNTSGSATESVSRPGTVAVSRLLLLKGV